jgi:urease accessory protein
MPMTITGTIIMEGIMVTRTDMAMPTDTGALLRLHSWLSPSFPVGAYAYSHGLEYAVEAGFVYDGASLTDWLDADLRSGAGWTDAGLFRKAHESAAGHDDATLFDAAELAAALRGSSELALESTAQGKAFVAMVAKAWPSQHLDRAMSFLAARGVAVSYPVAVAVCCAAHSIALSAALPVYLQAAVANLISAGVRLVPLGQSDGMRAVAALEPAVAEVAAAALAASDDDFGSAALMVDWAAMQHETQYTRLFRS